jgi:hypothetical protein
VNTPLVLSDGPLPMDIFPKVVMVHRRKIISHERAGILNTTANEAQVEIVNFCANRDTVGPYRVMVASRCTKHMRFNAITDPEPIPMATAFASTITSNVPIIAQHTRQNSRQAENAMLSTVAFPVGGS